MILLVLAIEVLKEDVASETRLLAVDILGPIPVTENGYKYVLDEENYLTKWKETSPTPP